MGRYRGGGVAGFQRFRLAWLTAGVLFLFSQVQASPVDSTSLSERFAAALKGYLGTPYAGFCLGEGDTGVFDADPRFDFRRVDCVTLIEQCLAEALAGGRGEGFLPALDRIRYADGSVGFLNRNHFFITDWIPANGWLVEDVTESLAGGETLALTRTIGKRRFFRPFLKEMTDSLVADVANSSLRCLAAARAAQAVAGLRQPLIVSFIGRQPDWLYSLHVGALLPTGEDGGVRLIHASSDGKAVVEEDFLDYLRRHPKFIGVVLLALKD